MCTYNGARHVGEQLQSIAAQTRPPAELIVCDDHSTDDTADIVRRFAEAAPFPVRLMINEQNLGSTRNFDGAIRACEGDLIALADQDDVWMPHKLEKIEAEFARPNVGLVFTDGDVVDEHMRPLGYTIWQSLDFNASRQEMFRRGATFQALLSQNVVTGATMAFRASYKGLVLPLREAMLSRYGVKNWKFIHDAWIALMIAAVADVVPLSESLLKYRQHSAQQLGINAPIAKEDPAQSWRERSSGRYKELIQDELRLLTIIRERLAERTGFDCRKVLDDVNARVEHLEARLNLSDNRFARIPTVLRELFGSRYFRYSNGLLSAARDLFL